jgi:DNA-binding transcriptional ArsR family regulator
MTKLVSVFSALGDPTRFHIVELLSNQANLCVSEVAQAVGISTAGVSQHMKILERAGLVRPERLGQKICYRLESETNRRILQLLQAERSQK